MALRRNVAAANSDVVMQDRAAKNIEAVNFGDYGMYVAGGGIPDGDYVWKSLDVQTYQAQNQQTGVSRGPARLGVMITLQPAGSNKPEDEKTQFYSMGSKADQSFAPNAATGKGVVRVAGGPASTFNNSTNWAMLLKSLYDCGMPQGHFSNNTTVLEGLSVHMQNIPEPEERKGFRAATGESAMEEPQGARTIPIVSEVYNAPWEAKASIQPAPVDLQKTTRFAAPAPPAGVNGGVQDDAAVEAAAINGISSVLEKKPTGCPRLVLRTEAFKEIKAKEGEQMASTVIQLFFEPGMEDNLSGVLGQLGYKVAGSAIQPA